MKSTSSFVASSLKWAGLAGLLAASVAVGACQDTLQDTAVSENENERAAEAVDATLDDAYEEGADTTTTERTDDSMSADEQLMTTLSRYRWRLDNAIDDSQQPITSLLDIKDQVSLRFNQNQGQNSITYSVGCNTVSAAYTLKDATLISDDGMSTKVSCPDLDAAENQLIGLMQGESVLDISPDKPPMLTQVTDEGAALSWRGRMTAQAKYKSKGETLFWAVSAETVPCEDNNSQMCLQVKPITYNDQGIKTSEGEWRQFAGTIDGYKHDNAHDEVLRLQRYKTDTDTVLTDNIDSNYAYVLDTVIESSVAQ